MNVAYLKSKGFVQADRFMVGCFINSQIGIVLSSEIIEHMGHEDIEELKEIYEVQGAWPHGKVSQPCITGKDFKAPAFLKPSKDSDLPGDIRIKNQTLMFGKHANVQLMWHKFIHEGIIPELEQQGVEVVYVEAQDM